MPVTKTAKRALRSSRRKEEINKKTVSGLEIALRVARKTKKEKDIRKAESLTDKAKKKNVIHKNKAARIKSALSKLLSNKAPQNKVAIKKLSKGQSTSGGKK